MSDGDGKSVLSPAAKHATDAARTTTHASVAAALAHRRAFERALACTDKVRGTHASVAAALAHRRA